MNAAMQDSMVPPVTPDEEPRFLTEADFFDPEKETYLHECLHLSTSEQFMGPDNRSGSGPVVEICDDCGMELRTVGRDSVL